MTPRLIILWGISLLLGVRLTAQERKIVEIRQAGSFAKDEARYPGANILLKKGNTRVKLFHEGALIESDQSFFLRNKKLF